MRSWPALVLSGFDASAPPDLVEAALVDYALVAIEEAANGSWHVYFATNDARDAARAALTGQFPSIAAQALDVPDEDWAARSQASLTQVRVGDLIVAPPWDIPGKAQGTRLAARAHTVVIQPSMGFGTGHHATTRLCLAALQEIDLAGRTVVDVGTGSGVLAIAASLLGAAAVLGIDDDPDAIQAARENGALNPAARVAFEVVDLRAARVPPVDVVLANLTGALLVSAAATLTALATPGGTLIVSGLLQEEEPAVRAAFVGVEATRRAQEDEWVCLSMRRP